MSDAPQESTESTKSSKPACCGGGGHRALYCILGILGLLVAAFCFEMYVARPAAQGAFDKIADARLKSIVDETTLTNLDIHTLLGKEPSETYLEGGDQFEVYHWIGGMVVNSHKLYTVYQQDGDDWIFVRHSRFADDAIENTAVIVEAPEDLDEDELYGADTSDAEGGGPPQASGAGGDGGNDGEGNDGPARPEMEEDDKTEDKTKPETDDDSEDESQN